MADLTKFLRIDPDSSTPIYAQLRQQIAWLIASRELKEGEQLPPIQRLAEQLGINKHTVHMAYKRLDADGIVSARRGRGTVVLPYQPLHFVREEPNLPSFTIGVLTPSLNPFYTPFIQGVEEAAREAQLLLFLCHTHDDTWLARRSLQQLITKQVEGLILASTRVLIGDEMSGKRNRRHLLPPIVYVDEPDAQEHVILIDGEGAGYRATTHLIEHGHSRIGLITAPIEWSNVHECYQGYQRALVSAGIAADPELIVEEPLFTIECGYQGMLHLLELKDPPTAVFAAGDILAIGAMQAIKGRGQQVPEDIAIVGYNNIELASLVEPALTTTNAPTYQMGVEAMMMLQRLRTGQPVIPKRLMLDTELIIRNSCGCQA